MKEKATIAVCGLMDSGKSTLIKSLLRKNTGRIVEPDALCIEQATGRTITGSRIACPIDEHTDIVFCDCPGHMEYLPEIVSGLCASRGYILIMDESRRDVSERYFTELHRITSALGIKNIAVVHSHSQKFVPGEIHYDVNDSSFDHAMQALLLKIECFLKSEPECLTSETQIVWFDELDGSTRYQLHDNLGHSCEWHHQGSHSPGESQVITDLPEEVEGRFLVCHARKAHIVGVGRAVSRNVSYVQ